MHHKCMGFILKYCAKHTPGVGNGLADSRHKNVITIDQLFFLRDGLKLVLTHYKHSDPAKPVESLIYREHPVCPVSLMLDYVIIRGNAPGPLFCWTDGSSISRSYFTRSLKEVLQRCDLDEDR